MQYTSPINPSSLPRVPLQPSSVPTRWNSSVLSSSASVNRFSSASASFRTSKKRPVQTQTQQTFDDVRLVVQTRKILPTDQNANSVGYASSNSTSSSQASSASNSQLQSPRQPNKTLIPVTPTPALITIQTVNESSITPTGKGGENIQLQSVNSALSVISTNKTKGSINLKLGTQSTQMPLGNLASSSSSPSPSPSSSSSSSISAFPSFAVSSFASVSATASIFPEPSITQTTTSIARTHSSTAHRSEISTSNTPFSTTFELAMLRSFFDDTSFSVSASLLAPAIVLGGSSTASIQSSSSSSS
ncbi:autophagy-related protein 11 (Atg11) [Monocercomonoides exilis]|uniref:autophagy-related protein 11 (Atg11) n=1 Tax=Monocercomonoides exilis TaxID=2049356 RepID=UPI00355AA288|nr:autophagy-related protein 11 (Atg11) [Monocercomonoides exilis]|eukprot:MONOS_816.1-p1 / transcript=MONOS_816.1 / gene=MONOS_816 / organism=Monocercomonoides_exilis_PA203 / gene_product=putative autophagy-related protein 11 (Atg11) / transcript_product=putative autophagy-related protein 11 (Atg11) / location=Mono_scaffold00013:196557-197465(+) / protein_length=303 / sequence_SO=supercontig / SO=protein_coding / is_pseudo=false